MPEIIIVKKVFPKYRKKHKKRNWKLKHIDKEAGGGDDDDAEWNAADQQQKQPVKVKAAKKGKSKKHLQNKDDQNQKDMELFMQDIEEDPEFRANVNLFKLEEETGKVEEVKNEEGDESWESVEEDIPLIPENEF